MKRRTRQYNEEFKLNAIKLYLESDNSFKVVAKELGMPHRTLGTWVENFKKDKNEDFTGEVNLHLSHKEIMELKQELRIAREERDILKKALGVFSSHRK